MISDGPGKVYAFNAHEVKIMKRGLQKNSTHVIARAPSLDPTEFKQIIGFLSNLSPAPSVIIAALLIGYSILLRQSNQVPSSPQLMDNPHFLRFGDIKLAYNKLLVTVRCYTETWFGSSQPVTFQLPELPKSLCCPVGAWVRYSHHLEPTLKGCIQMCVRVRASALIQ